jgi:uncharacterized protein YegP (UPF0339 family)
MAKFFLCKNIGGKFFFQYKCNSGRLVLTSEMYDTRESCMNGIVALQENAATTTVRDMTDDKHVTK